MIRGMPLIDGIALGEISVSFLGATMHVEAKAAFVSTTTGITHGWTKSTQWSEATREKIRELRDLMEVDLGNIHLSDSELVVGSVRRQAQPMPKEVGGIGEHLGSDDDVPPI